MSSYALDLVRQRLAAADPAAQLPAQEASPNTHADPLGISSRSMYVKGIRRPDRSTIGPRGNTVSPDQLAVITTSTNVGRNDHSSPSGTDEP